MNKNSKIYVAGHRGMVGSAIVRLLESKGFKNLVVRTSKELDLRNQEQVNRFFLEEKPEYVFLAAAKVGGILANRDHKAEFYYDNAMIAQNVIHASYVNKVKKLMNLGSSCIYPKMAPQPMKEEYLLTGPLEDTNDAYAIAKISAIKMCHYYNSQFGTNYLSVMPTNLYGINDNYDLQSSHVLPAMIRKFHEAKINDKEVVELWGDGSPYREFLYADDLADAVVYLMENKNAVDLGEFVNVGTGEDLSIKDLAELISEVIGFKGKLNWDTSKPNGTPKKLLNVDKLRSLGWEYQTKLKNGIMIAYNEYRKEIKD
ncbi:MAG: GDP-L-fucose synthase [Spirochaetales bacterium]|nr:GDP-L-fucose synthase [Spirochaetales bacterium]